LMIPMFRGLDANALAALRVNKRVASILIVPQIRSRRPKAPLSPMPDLHSQLTFEILQKAVTYLATGGGTAAKTREQKEEIDRVTGLMAHLRAEGQPQISPQLEGKREVLTKLQRKKLNRKLINPGRPLEEANKNPPVVAAAHSKTASVRSRVL
jgi:hypothetical protein